MKEGAENVERKIQAKVESLKNANESEKGISLKHHQHWITIIPVLGIFICYVKTARFYVLFLCTFFYLFFQSSAARYIQSKNYKFIEMVISDSLILLFEIVYSA